MSAIEKTGLTAEQQEWLDGLRAITDWFERHPDHIDNVYGVVAVNLYPTGKEALAQLARDLGRVDKIHEGTLFTVRRRFGPHNVDGSVMRATVCQRVVTGMEQIPEKVTPAHEKEIVEWVCDEPLLASVKT